MNCLVEACSGEAIESRELVRLEGYSEDGNFIMPIMTAYCEAHAADCRTLYDAFSRDFNMMVRGLRLHSSTDVAAPGVEAAPVSVEEANVIAVEERQLQDDIEAALKAHNVARGN